MAVYYLNFSENRVFDDALLNTSFNQIYTFLISNLGEGVLFDIMLDGDVAKVLQNISVNNGINELEIITTSKSVFNFFKASYSALNISQVLTSNNYIIFIVNEYKFKLTYTPTPVSSIIIQGVFVKQIL